MRSSARPLAIAVAAAALAAAIGGCGKQASHSISQPALELHGAAAKAPPALGFPVFATKNTTRVGGLDAVSDAAAVSRAVFPSLSAATRPRTVALADGRDWRSALAATVLMSAPIHAPLLLGAGLDLPDASAQALRALAPSGSKPAGGAQVVRIGDVARPKGLRTTDLVGRDPFTLARAIDAFQASARGASSDRVMVVSADRPEFALPAAGWAAKSGDPILFAQRDRLPAATRAALAAHQQPRIYVLGPSSVISPAVTGQLRKLGTVTRVGGADPQRNAIAFARFTDARFGWGAVDPGHGLVIANPTRPLDAAAAAPLSASGTYGPLLLADEDGELSKPLSDYLLDIKPGYTKDPARGVYNHAWIVGDDRAVTVDAQSRIDALLEIAPVNNRPPAQQP